MERSLVLVKPDGVQRALIGEVISRLERRGLRLVAAKFMEVSKELAETHYGIHKGKPFYDGLIEYIISAPVMAMVWEGPNAVAAIRQTMGATRPTEAAPGSLRHDFASKWDAISLTRPIASRTARTKSPCGSSPQNSWTGRVKWIVGCLRSRLK